MRDWPDLLTEDEVIQFLRIPEVCGSARPRNVIDNLKRVRDLPRIRISHKALYPKAAVLQWIGENLEK